MKGFTIAVLAAVAILGGVNARPNNKIVGGDKVSIEQTPYQVSMQFLESHMCGGSIIGPRQIVTAAHCTDGLWAQYLAVRVGSSYHAMGGQYIKVAEVKQHPLYNDRTTDYDISILILQEDIQFNDAAQPIALPEEGQNVPEGTDALVTGWGALWSNGPSPSHLQGATLPIVSREQCQTAYANKQITDRMICGGYLGIGGIDACQGDSGGPLESYGKLIGVVSWGIGCAHKDYPGVFSNVSNLRSFIRENADI